MADDRADRRHLVITGLMGVGKTTTAELVAAELGRVARDSDADLRRLFGVTGAELAAAHGVDELHRLEAAVLLGALADEQPAVVCAAAWVVEDPRCREALARRAVTVVLTAPIEELIGRIPTGPHRRPIDPAELRTLAERRRPLFEQVGDLLIDSTLPPAEVAAMVMEAVGRSIQNSPPR